MPANSHLKLKAAALAGAALLLLSTSGARAALIERAEWLKLSSGLQVVLVPQRSTPLVASTVIVRAGSRHEPEGLTGATHFLEHLLFNGTARRTQKELYDAIDRIGAYNNASTRADVTIFQLLVHRDNLAEGLDIQADMLFNSTLPEEKFEKERGIVIEEIGQTFDKPGAQADRFFMETLFASTPYSRPVLGTPSSIESLSRQAVLDYYRVFYQPANMTLVLVGGFERDKVLPLVEKTFGSAKGAPPPDRQEVRGLELAGRNVVGRKAEANRTYLTLSFRAPRMTEPMYPAFTTLVALLNEGSTSRLEQLFKGEGAPSVYSISADVLSAQEAPALTISATLPPETDVRAVIERLLGELERIAGSEVSAEALERSAVEERAEDAFLAENILYYAFFKAPELASASPEWVKSLPDRIQKVTREDVIEAAKTFFSGKPFLATMYGPNVPEGEQKWEAQASEAPRASKSESATGAEAKGSEAREKPASAILERTLANGLTIIVKESPDTQIFALHLLARDRALWEPEGKDGIAELMHRLLPEGTKHRSAEEVSRSLSSIGARLKVTDNPAIPYDDYYQSPEYSYIRFEVMDSFALEGLAEVADMVLHPLFAEEAVERIKRQQLDDIAQSEEQARVKASRLFRKTLFGENPVARLVLGSASSVESITAGDLRAFHSAYFAPANLILTVVSPRRAEEVAGWLDFFFAQAPKGAGPPPAWPALAASPSAKEVSEEAGKAQSYLFLGQVLDVPKEDREAFEVMNAVLSDRLAIDLREKRGLAYSVGSSVVETRAGWYFAAGLGTRKESLDEAKKGILEAIGRLQSEPPGKAELEKTVNGLIGASYRRRMTSISQAYFLGLDAFRGDAPGGEEAWAARLLKVSPDEVVKAAKRLKPEEMAVVTVR